MMEEMKPRRSKVYGTNPPLRTTYAACIEGAPPIPALRLRGRWLAQAGFAIGACVEIIVADGELVVRALPRQG
jgi:hypothetical protein